MGVGVGVGVGGGEGGTQETRNPLEKKDDLGPWWRRRLREGPGTPMGGSQEGPLGGELKGERVVALPSAVTHQAASLVTLLVLTSASTRADL